MFDYHLHSDISADSTEPAVAHLLAAKQLGFHEICFTEHVDISPTDAAHNFIPDLQRYQKMIGELRAQFPEIKIKMGLELGVNDGMVEVFAPYATALAFDFILNSLHFIGGEDPFYGNFFTGKTRVEAFETYLQETLRTLKQFDHYDVVGHIGYPSKYYPDQSLAAIRYHEHADTLDELLTYIVQAGKGIEINTSCMPVYGDTLPSRDIVARYVQLGGEIITIGSDAHKAQDLGRYYHEALQMLDAAGAKYICTFTQRQAQYHKISTLL